MLLPLKMGVWCIYAYSLFEWNSWDIRGLRCAMLELISATFFRRNTLLF